MTQAVLRPHDQLTHDEFTAISKAVHEFEALWRQTRSPAIEPFLPEVSDPLRLRLLIELLRIDQEHRWERGDRRLLEQYLQEWPELSEQPVAIQELLSAECLTRFCLEDSPTLDELRQRFPLFADGVDLDRLRATAIAEKGEASTAKAVNDATVITLKPPPVDDENGLHPTASFPPKAESSAVLAARRIGLLTGRQFGRYEVRRLVGTGGMGAVYEARDTQLERIVALKIPRGELVNDPVILQRFLNEARAAGAIRHPHICPIYDVGKIDEQHFITMPLVQGMSLSAWMEHRTVSLHEAAELTRKLASALQAIHAVGIRHRDIKASNVMIDERGEPLLMDFGLARLAQTDTHVTQSGSLVGTPAYMAPEQIQLGASGGDERSDVYSLGVLLYQMLTGCLPFEGPMTRVLVQIATKDPPRLEVLRPDVDKELADICRQAMSRESSQRYQTAAEFELALAAWLKSRPLTPRPKSRPPVEAADEPGVHQTRDAQSASVLPVADQHSGIEPPSRNRKATKVSLAAFLLALAAVIVIQISDRAELIIKSKVEGLEVKVIQLDQPAQERTLTFGENSVRVRSGQVEVVLTGDKADEYEVVSDKIAGDKIVLKRFGREVVEIKPRQLARATTPSPSGTVWHGWPADAPPPAIAPFDAEQATQHQKAWATYLNLPIEHTNSIGMKFRLIPPGEFTMGGTPAEIEDALKGVEEKEWQEFLKSEAPQRKVILTQPIYLGVHEVTQSQYEKMMGKNPSRFAPMAANKDAIAGMETTNHPVEYMSWNDVAEFCAKLSHQEHLKPFYFRAGGTVTPLDGTGYRLPTEAEWEFSCRAGTTTRYWTGDKDEDLMRAGWFGANSGGRTHEVGELKPNPYGLFDMHGNVWEWVQDWWEPSYYAQFQDKPAINPSGPTSSVSRRMLRGGCWNYFASLCRSSVHDIVTPTAPHNYGGGFRVSLPVDAVRQVLKGDGPKTVKPGGPVGANRNPVAEQGRSAWDDLDPAQIPEAERVPRQPEGLVAVLGQHRRRVWNVLRSTSVSPDGTQFTLTTDDGLYLFGRDLKQPARFFNLGVGDCAATYLPDGRIAAFVNDRGMQLQIFAKPRDGMPLEKQSATNTNSDPGIHYPTVSSDGRWLAAGEYPDNIAMWKLDDATPQRVAKFALSSSHGNIWPGSFSPDSHWFCVTNNSSLQSAVHLIDLRGDTPREATVLKADADEKSDAPAKGFEHATFLSDGRLATSDRNGHTWFWRINDGEPQRVGSIRATGQIQAASQSLRLVTNDDNTLFRVWNLAVEPPQLLGAASPSFPADNTQTLTISPNGETIFTGHLNKAVRIWNVSTSGVTEVDPLVPNPRPHSSEHHVKVIDRFLCASTETSRVGIWRPTRNGLQAVLDESSTRWVLGASAIQRRLIVAEPSPDGGSAGTALFRFDADRVTPARRITGNNVRSAALNDEGRRLAIGRHNGSEEAIELWGWESDDLPARKLSEIKSSSEHIHQLAFADAGRALVGRIGPRIQIWDGKDDQFIPRTILPRPYILKQFAVAPDGQTLATVAENGLDLWNLKSDLTQPTQSFAIGGTGAVGFSPDGRRLAASFWENGASAGVQIINLASGVVEKRLTFPGRVHELTFTDDGRHLITGNANATIYVVRLEEWKRGVTQTSPSKTTPIQVATPLPASSPWDDLDPAQIPEAEQVPRQPEGLVAVLGQHRRRVWNTIRSSSVSADGTQFLLTTDDGLYLYGRDPRLPAQLLNFGDDVSSATFLPDGRIAAFGRYKAMNEDTRLQIFAKPRDGMAPEKQTATIANNTGEAIHDAIASSDGQWLAARDVNKSISLWKLDDASPQRAATFMLPAPHGNVYPGSFSPDAHWFCFTDNGNVQSAIHLIDLRGDTPREATVLKADADEKSDAPAKGFEHAAFLSDGRLATSDRNGRIWFWKINDGEPTRTGGSITGSIADRWQIAPAVQSLRMAVSGDAATFNVWDVAADPPRLLGKSSSTFSGDNVRALALAPNGETIFTGHLNGAVRFWSVSLAGVTELDPLAPNPNSAYWHRYWHSRVVDRLLCASLESSRVGIWRPTRDGLQSLVEDSPSHLVLGASAARRQLIVREQSTGGGTAILQSDGDRVTPTRRITGNGPTSAALSDDGHRLAITRNNGTDEVLELWGWESEELPARKLSEVKSSPVAVAQPAFAEGGHTLVGRVGHYRVQIWDVKDDQLIPRMTLPLLQYGFLQFAVAPNGRTLATVGYSTLALWDLKSDLAQPTTTFTIPSTTAVAFSPDGRRVAASFWENGASAGVQIINLATGVVEKRLTFPGRVHELTFTDDSRHLITGNANGTVYVVRLEGVKPVASR